MGDPLFLFYFILILFFCERKKKTCYLKFLFPFFFNFWPKKEKKDIFWSLFLLIAYVHTIRSVGYNRCAAGRQILTGHCYPTPNRWGQKDPLHELCNVVCVIEKMKMKMKKFPQGVNVHSKKKGVSLHSRSPFIGTPLLVPKPTIVKWEFARTGLRRGCNPPQIKQCVQEIPSP